MEQRKPSFGERWSQARPTKTVVFWACAASIVATLIVGFTWGGWVTGGTALRVAEARADDAIAKRLAPMCVLRFKADHEKDAKLAELKKASSWEQTEYVQKQGWATMPGEESPDRKVAEECAKLLLGS
jgi:hypothetical protein